MKNTILVVVMILVATRLCLAQATEPDGFLSIEGTRWRTCGISTSVQFSLGGSDSGFNFNIGCSGNSYWFHDGKVYSCNSSDFCAPLPATSYIDTPLVGIGVIPSTQIGLNIFIMQPTGFGVYTNLYWGTKWGFGMGIMFKVRAPEPQFRSIAPSEATQEMFLSSVTLTCWNTTFTDGMVYIQFIPQDGLTVSNISIQSNTEIEFDLGIAGDAPPGIRSLLVTYNNPPSSVVGNAVFEVLQGTN